MAKPEWGTKRTCFSCGARFYDLRREPVICPICSTVYDPMRHPRPKRSGPSSRDDAAVVPALAGDELAATAGGGELLGADAGDSDLDDVDEDADGGEESDIDGLNSEDDEIIEDASELGEDDDDIGEVMEHVDDELDDKA